MLTRPTLHGKPPASGDGDHRHRREPLGYPLLQIGGEHQEPYLEWAERKLLPALREL
ncbi:hypothetical protein [Streptomyces sp. SID12488]|uniref:hypothetical protein n=1 Tax=Streptomyces sp. SID12488 TaxID=2706040 RepID=UPI0013DACA6B|nr:hypothetical protein [Streptomyces sp. SID12488]NEA68560.1 hypothetical protein [Streptomyces sp. SID12488]